MKKLFYAAAFAAVAFAFSSCAKEDPAEGVSIPETFTQRATITGTAFVTVIQNGNSIVQHAPAGTILVFTAENANFIHSSTGNFVTTTTVQANGTYAVSFPTPTDGSPIDVTIQASDFSLSNIVDGTNNTNKTNLFSSTDKTVSIFRNGTFIENLTYTAKPVNESQEQNGWTNGTFEMSFYYLKDASDATIEGIPTDFTVTIVVKGADLFPARTTDYVFTAPVVNGVLKFDLNAPTAAINSTGLNFTIESGSVILPYKHTNGEGETVTDNFVYSVPTGTGGFVFGGTKVDKPKVALAQGKQLSNN